MGDAPVLSGATKGDAFADGVAEDITGDRQIKGTPTDEDSATESPPHKAGASPVPAGVPEEKRKHVVRAAFTLLAASPVLRAFAAFTLLAASPVLRAFAAVFSKVTPTRAAFLVSTLLALWLSAGEPSSAVWTFSLCVISYLAMWSIYLSKVLRPLTVVVSVTYVMLLAIAVTNLSSAAGLFLMMLDMGYAAGLFGYALAEYRLRQGWERSAEALQTRVKNEDLKNDEAVITMVSLYATIASVLSTAGVVWVLFYVSDIYWLVILLSLLIDLSLFCWVGFVGMHLLHGVLFADDHLAFFFWGIALLLLPDCLISNLFGESIGVLMHPIGVMSVAGVLGYSLSVYVGYKNISTL